MKKLATMALAAASVLALAAPARAADSDADFVARAASDGMLEVELGQHAAKNAMDPAVRHFGEMMAADHAKAGQELKAAAAKVGITVPAEMGDAQQMEKSELLAKQGEAFDFAYMDAMVDAHEKAIDHFRAQATQDETEIDRFAARTLPTLQKHLTEAKAVRERVAPKVSR
jgi:putative membrane protein